MLSLLCLSHFLVTASNSGDSSASALTSLPAGSQLHGASLFLTDSLTSDYYYFYYYWWCGTESLGIY
jgi:hypothetical protein